MPPFQPSEWRDIHDNDSLAKASLIYLRLAFGRIALNELASQPRFLFYADGYSKKISAKPSWMVSFGCAGRHHHSSNSLLRPSELS